MSWREELSMDRPKELQKADNSGTGPNTLVSVDWRKKKALCSVRQEGVLLVRSMSGGYVCHGSTICCNELSNFQACLVRVCLLPADKVILVPHKLIYPPLVNYPTENLGWWRWFLWAVKRTWVALHSVVVGVREQTELLPLAS